MTLVINRVTLDTLPEFKLREADERECKAAGLTGEIAVRRSVAGSDNAFACYVDEELLCLWGFRYESRISSIGQVWLLSTDAVERHPIPFARASRKMVEVLSSEVETLHALVHVEHTIAIRWLKWLGFNLTRNLTPRFITMTKRRG